MVTSPIFLCKKVPDIWYLCSVEGVWTSLKFPSWLDLLLLMMRELRKYEEINSQNSIGELQYINWITSREYQTFQQSIIIWDNFYIL